jgi:hypothetical protein
MRRSLFVLRMLLALLIASALTQPVAHAASPSPLAVQPAAPSSKQLAQASSSRLRQIRRQEPTYTDDFSTDAGTWDLLYDGETSRYFRAGRYHVNVDVERTIAWGISNIEASNLYLEVDAELVAGSDANEAAVIFRYEDSDNFYFFAVSYDGYYTLLKQEDDEWETLIEWESAAQIDTGVGAVNRIGVLAEGTEITLVINGDIVDVVDDDSFTTGAVGLAVGTFENPTIDVAFDDFKLWNLDDQQPEPTPTSPVTRPIIQPRATATPAPGSLGEDIEAIRAGEPTYQESFQRDTDAWTIPTAVDYSVFFEDQALHILVSAADRLGSSVTRQEFSNFLIELDAQLVRGPEETEYGLLVRHTNGQNFYFFAITADGAYSVWKKVDDEWIALRDWERSPALTTGLNRPNRLGVLAQANELVFYVNGTILTELEDDAFSSGQLGLAAGTFAVGNAEVAFSAIDLWDLDSTTPTGQAPTATPTASLAPAGDILEQIAQIRTGLPTFSDDFRRDTRSWTMEPTDSVEYTYQGRALHISVAQPRWIAWSFHERTLTDFFAEVDVAQVEGNPDGAYGLIFRFANRDNFYIYRITADGYYSLWRKVGGEWEMMVDWTATDALETGLDADNRIAVLAMGAEISLLANNQVIYAGTDGLLPVGQVGLAAGTYEEPAIKTRFDNFALWDLAP